MPQLVKAILETLLCAAGCFVVLSLIWYMFDEVFDYDITTCLTRVGWRENPVLCGITVFIIASALFALIATFTITVQGGGFVPTDDYIRSDEPYRTWP